MKVLHINKRADGGGASTASIRLHLALLKREVNSSVLYEFPSTGIPKSFSLRAGRGSFPERFRGRANRALTRLFRRHLMFDPTTHTATSINYTSNQLRSEIDRIDPDIVHLHWVGDGYLRIEDLPHIARKRPVIWTLHDMWPFCGAEHYAYRDERWRNGYTRENQFREAKGPDLNRWVWRRKQKAWAGLTIHTVGVSRWTDECVRSSCLFRGIKGLREVIHNGLDENVFCAKLNVEDGCGVTERPWRIAFGAASQANAIKGGDLLVDALRHLQGLGHSFELITFGSGEVSGLGEVPVDNRGHIASPGDLSSLYRSVDLMVVPSRLETFGQTASEALACATPVVCFDTSGLRDIVDHKENGYRARCFDPEDLARGIHWCLCNPHRFAALRRRARETVMERFRIDAVAVKTVSLYEKVLNSSGGARR